MVSGRIHPGFSRGYDGLNTSPVAHALVRVWAKKALTGVRVTGQYNRSTVGRMSHAYAGETCRHRVCYIEGGRTRHASGGITFTPAVVPESRA
jgi:hypothetical protein